MTLYGNVLLYNCKLIKEVATKMITNEQINNYAIDDCGLTLTDNLNESLYLMTDGKMISGCDEYGERSEDHRCMLSLVLNGKNYYVLKNQAQAWKKLHKETGLIRICPETKEALISSDQVVTPEQQELLKEAGYQVEKYI